MSITALTPALVKNALSSFDRTVASSGSHDKIGITAGTQSSSLIDKVFGVFSGVFLLGSLGGIISHCSELYYGPSDELRKKFWDKYVRSKLLSDVGRDAASAVSSFFYIVNALRGHSWIRSKMWGYNTVSAVAGCFGALSSVCTIASQVMTVKAIDRMLQEKISMLKVSLLKDHRASALYDIAASVANIALIILFTTYSFVGAPMLLGSAVVLFIITSPLQYQAIYQKIRNYFSHKDLGRCCQLLA